MRPFRADGTLLCSRRRPIQLTKRYNFGQRGPQTAEKLLEFVLQEGRFALRGPLVFSFNVDSSKLFSSSLTLTLKDGDGCLVSGRHWLRWFHLFTLSFHSGDGLAQHDACDKRNCHNENIRTCLSVQPLPVFFFSSALVGGRRRRYLLSGEEERTS